MATIVIFLSPTDAEQSGQLDPQSLVVQSVGVDWKPVVDRNSLNLTASLERVLFIG
jgi:hypothetical protein